MNMTPLDEWLAGLPILVRLIPALALTPALLWGVWATRKEVGR